MDYIQQTSVGFFDEAQDAIDKAKEEHGDVTVETKTEDRSTNVDPGESVQDMADMAMPARLNKKDETKSDDSVVYTRQMGFKKSREGVRLDVPDEFERADETKERLEEIRMINEELERQDQKRRYVATESDAPDDAHIFEDAFGEYYYKTLSITVRPSDVAEYAGKNHHGALDKAEKAAQTVELMYALDPAPLFDANTLDAAKNWLERHLVLTDEDPGNNDTFSHEFKNQIAAAISNAASEEK